MLQEERRCPVEERMARQFRPTDKAHKTKIGKRLHDSIHTNAADLLHFGLGDGLAVGDDRQRLQRGSGKTVRTIQLQQRAHVASAHGRRLQPVLTSRADERETALRHLKRLFKSAQSLLDLAGRTGLVNFHHLGVITIFRLYATHTFAQLSDGEW